MQGPDGVPWVCRQRTWHQGASVVTPGGRTLAMQLRIVSQWGAA